ncbi:MAG: hypothetical protein O9343_04615 [Burkholderiaceae bacterium]|jgi:hypothetical protein|nr:hypothetical protein [Burkholderiaceae bacterium]MCZ8174457.1 hypothetical protein [Burkholderiaceae bacterium]
MGVLSRILKPIVQAATAFFRHDLALKRGEQGVAIVLEARPAPSRKPSRREQREDEARRLARAELDMVLQQLKALLDEFPGSRVTLRQLVFVETALQKKGLKALHKLPLPVLEKSLEQLEGLVTNWSPAGLASLRSRMAVAIIDREHQDPEREADAYRTAAVLDPQHASEARGPGPAPRAAPTEPEPSDDEALAAAYAQLGAMAPLGVIELQGELGSRSTRSLAKPPPRPTESAGDIQIRKLEHTASA